MSTQTEGEWLRIGAVTLAARDLGRVAAFYRDIIGLTIIEADAGTVLLGAGGTAFLTVEARQDARPDEPAAAGLYHTAFLLPTRADLAQWLMHLGQSGVPLDGSADHLVSEAFYLHDPEGNGIEVYWDRPPSSWTWAPGRQVEMANKRIDMTGLLAEAKTAWAGAPAGTRIGHVHLRVGDTGEAQRFYAGLVGLDVTRAWPGALFMSTGGYHHHLAANSWDSAGAAARDPRRTGLAAVTFDLSGSEALDGIARRTGAADIVGAGLRDPWGTALHFRLT